MLNIKEKVLDMVTVIGLIPVDTSPLPDTEAGPSAIQRGLSTTFLILGAASVFVITLAGLRYVVSHGDPKVIAQSKNAILYAVVGLIVSALSFAIVNFVIGNLS